ncbi:TetR/AcrR family transcriptional regulator [Gryllotalpicola reticulitermitis]|uniref:TetR/AcrR family transcriptional regulator n=1 Tax=Gryllotalpicola reticulitermitis TaxID=1184153 RepID=A0ABV8Q5Q0_9MICO
MSEGSAAGVADIAAHKTRGPYRNGIKRRREIILAASKVFGQYGYAGGSLRQIALDVGVTPAALTRHFENKEGLLIAVLEHWDVENDRVMPADVRGLTRFMLLPYNAYQHTLDRGLIEMFLTIAAESSNPNHPLHQFVKRRYDRLMVRALGELHYAQEHGEILPMDDEQMMREVRAVYALMDGLQLQWLLNPDIDLLRILQDALGHFIQRWTGKPVVWADPRIIAKSVEAERAD